MTQFKSSIALLCVLLIAAPGMYSQKLEDRAPRFDSGDQHWYSSFTHPFNPKNIPPVSLGNSGRLDSLVRGGNLYLSLNDAIALTLENNIDVEVSRYGFLTAENSLYSARAGGNGVPNLDPVLTGNLGWAHNTQIQTNTVTTGNTSTVSILKTGNFGLQQGFITGGTATLGFNNNNSDSNVLRNSFNPVTSSNLDLQINQPLLNGFGIALNNRNIRVAKNNIRVNDYQFQQQLNTTLNTVIGAYWNLVSAALNVEAVQATLDQARTLYENNKKQLEIGTMAPIDVTTAQAQVTSSETNLLVAQAAVQTSEVSLKNVISRNGLGSASIADVHIIATDRITVPDVEPVQPIQDRMAKALDSRPELAQLRLQLDNSKISLTGTRNAMLPSLNFTADLRNSGQAGQANAQPPSVNPFTGQLTSSSSGVDPYFVGGYGTVLSQIFGRNFPTYTVGATLNIPLRNRAAQAAYISADLNLRTQELALQKEINQIRSDVQNAQIAVAQARARYLSAQTTRQLEEQIVEAEQKKYELGASTTYNVILRQTDLSNARQSEVAALTSYALAKLQMDQAQGTILENNNVVIEEAKQGRVSRAPSPIPAITPNGGPNGGAPNGGQAATPAPRNAAAR